jgi:hypothetical protein
VYLPRTSRSLFLVTDWSPKGYCGNSFTTGSVIVADSDCNTLCSGNSLQFCGAGGRLTVYAVAGTPPPPTSTVSTTMAPTTTASVPTGFPTGWTSQGCWAEPANGRLLTHQQPDSSTNTLESCVQTCAGLGYKVAGAEFGTQCFCDNYVYNGGALAPNQADCNVRCPGNPAEFCGGPGRVTLYSIGAPQVFQPPAPQISGLPSGWRYSGCWGDNVPSAEDPNIKIPALPYQLWDKSTNIPSECIAQCQKFGFNAAGLEYGRQCCKYPVIAL